MYLVFDIGGTKTRIAYSKDLMTLSEPVIFYTPQSYDEGMKLIKAHITHFSKGHEIKAIMGGVAGVLTADCSRLLVSPNLPDWVNQNIKEDLEELFETRVYLQNDAALFALGETCFNSNLHSKKSAISAFLTISTGVGGARIVNKKIDNSGSGFEPGHQIIIPDGDECNCGGKGHLESYISGKSLFKKYHKKPSEITNPEIWDKMAWYLSLGLNNIIVLWSPEIIILGGGVAPRIPLEKIQRHLKDELRIYKKLPDFEMATLGDLGGLYGALEYLKQQN